MSFTIKRAAYADMFGPTTGDRVRLADTDLIIEVEKDFTTYGEEVKFGGGKVIRDGMGQSAGHQQAGRGRHRHHQRADPRPLGHREGRRRHQGRPHRRDRQGRQSRTSSRASTIVIGPGTEVIAGEGKILTAGGFDTHIHFICPQQVEEALMSGVTSHARRRHRPGARHQRHHLHARAPGTSARMIQAADAFPINLGFAGKGNASLPGGAGGDGQGRRLRAQAARGLGHDAGRDRQLPRRSPTTTTCR